MSMRQARHAIVSAFIELQHALPSSLDADILDNSDVTDDLRKAGTGWGIDTYEIDSAMPAPDNKLVVKVRWVALADTGERASGLVTFLLGVKGDIEVRTVTGPVIEEPEKAPEPEPEPEPKKEEPEPEPEPKPKTKRKSQRKSKAEPEPDDAADEIAKAIREGTEDDDDA